DIGRVDSLILQGALTEIDEHFKVLVGPYNTIQSDDLDLKNTFKFVHLVRSLAEWLVLDVPTTYDELFFESMNTADQIVIVAEQTVSAIRGTQIICDSLGSRRPMVVINRYSSKRSSLSIGHIQQFLPNCDVFTLPHDQAVIDSVNAGKTLRMHCA